MKLLALLVAFQIAFLFSVAMTPTAEQAAAALAPAGDAPRIVHRAGEIVVRR